MSDNRQTTDPLAESAQDPNPTEWPNALDAEDCIPATGRDPGKSDTPAGTPLARGSQASDF